MIAIERMYADRVLVWPRDAAERSAGGLFLATVSEGGTGRGRAVEGGVLAIGPGTPAKPVDGLSIGDRVVFLRTTAQTVHLPEECYIVAAGDILAVVDAPDVGDGTLQRWLSADAPAGKFAE